MLPEPYVLLVEDDEPARFLCSRQLKKTGLSATLKKAVDGVEAISLMRSDGIPSLMLLDLQMPRMDGREMLEYLDSERWDLACPLTIILSSSIRHDDLMLCQQYGFVCKFTEKPFTGNALKQVSENYEGVRRLFS